MDLQGLLQTAKMVFDTVGARYALIGAFGMSAHGYHRATNDIDFLVSGRHRNAVEQAFLDAGFSIFHASKEVLQLSAPAGQIDMIFANRPLSSSMLNGKNMPDVMGVLCLEAEDIIGLKIQAAVNDPQRRLRELADIQALCEVKTQIDWQRIKKYADLFDFWSEIEAIKEVLVK